MSLAKEHEIIEVRWSPTPRVSIVIPSTSDPDLLCACLRSLSRFAPADIPFETIVVLNQSNAGLEATLARTVCGVRFLSTQANLGMAGSGNRGRSHARGEFIVTLHDDAEVEAGWLEALVEAADAHPEAGAVGGKVLSLDGRLQSAGMILWSDALTSTPWCGKTPPASCFDRLRAVDYCGSSSLLVRASAWDAVGGLDERFYPAYFVDVDLSMALRRIGLVVLYQPKSRIRHHQGASGSGRFRAFISGRNRQPFIQKWADDLQHFEPPGRNSPEAIARAMERAENFAASRKGAGIPLERPKKEEAPFPTAFHDQLHIEKRHDLYRAYHAELSRKLHRKRPRRHKRWLATFYSLIRRWKSMI